MLSRVSATPPDCYYYSGGSTQPRLPAQQTQRILWGVDPPQQNQLTSTTAGGRPPSVNSSPLLLGGVNRGHFKIADGYRAHTENTVSLNWFVPSATGRDKTPKFFCGASTGGGRPPPSVEYYYGGSTPPTLLLGGIDPPRPQSGHYYYHAGGRPPFSSLFFFVFKLTLKVPPVHVITEI